MEINAKILQSYLMGQNNPDYSPLVAQIRSVIFLSTPHRGTNLSNILNGLLSVSLAGHTSKQYISDLNKNSAMIEDVNENFRNIAPQLQIFSFYETLETSVAFRSLVCLYPTTAYNSLAHRFEDGSGQKLFDPWLSGRDFSTFRCRPPLCLQVLDCERPEL